MSEPTLTKTSARPAMNTRTVTTLAMLSAIAYVVMLLSKLLPSVNGFLDFDFKDVIICIGGFTFGLRGDGHHQPYRSHRLRHERAGHLQLLLHRFFRL